MADYRRNWDTREEMRTAGANKMLRVQSRGKWLKHLGRRTELRSCYININRIADANDI
jgi:hypothetical protein